MEDTFAKLPIFKFPEIHPKAWGAENILYNGPEFCGKILKFKENAEFSTHYHRKLELWLVILGKLLLKYFDLNNGDELEKELLPGQVIIIPRYVPHKLKALEYSEVFEISEQHFDEDSRRIGKGDSQR